MDTSNSHWVMDHIDASLLPDQENAALPARMTRSRRTVRSRLASVFSWARMMQFPVADPPTPTILNPYIRREGR